MAEDTRNRSGYPRDEHGNDPLTELARLIGQNDPFSDKARRAAQLDAQEHRQAPGWLARAPDQSYDQPGYADDPNAPQPYAAYRAPPSHDDAGNDAYGDYAAPGSAYDDRYAQGHDDRADARYAHDSGAEARYADGSYERSGDDRYHVAPPSGEYEGDEYYDDGGHLPPQSEEQGGMLAGASRRGGLVTIAAVLGLAVIGTAGAFGYRALTGPSANITAPVIKADPNPAKITPAAPADASDKPFQERIATPGAVQTERIVPREETPVAQPVPPAQTLPGPPPWPTPPQPRAGNVTPPPSAAAPPPAENPGAKRVRTETIRVAPNGGDPNGTTRPPAPVPNAPRAKQNAPAPMTIGPSGEAAPPPARVQTSRLTTGTVNDGAYVVQVSAQKTEGEAQSSYRALQQKYPNVLGSREATIRRADLGDKGIYYRAQIGGFASAAEATNFCDSLKASGGQCIVQKN